MAMVLPAIVAGVVCADEIDIALWVAVLLLALSGVVAWLWRHPLSILLFVAMAGATSLSLRHSTERLPSRSTQMEICLEHIVAERDSSRTFHADLVAYNEDGEMRRSNSSIRISTPLEADCEAAERLMVHTKIYPYDSGTDFTEYMSNKGIAGYAKITSDDILHRQKEFSLGSWLQEKAQQRIDLLELSPATKSIATAISTGKRSQIPHAQRRHYTLAGGAHLLAVSGLHVGFVFVFINLLLLPLAALRYGTLWRTLLCIGFIWCYAALASLSPSVVRAATMFTLFQLSFIFSSRNLPLNGLCATVSLMLLWDGRILYDVGFLLSFLAVVAIIEWVTPLLGRFSSSEQKKLRRLRYMLQHPVRGRVRQVIRRLGIWIFSGVIVSFVANIATLPLVSLHFGEVSLWGVVVGFIMVALCGIATTVMLTWILMPIPLLAPVVGFVVEFSVGAMNHIAEWCAGMPLLNFSLSLDEWSCGVIYAAFLLLTIALWSIPRTNATHRYHL